MQHTGKGRKKTRQKFRKDVREKGKVSLTRYLQNFSEGDRVILRAEPGYQKGIYHGRFHGKSGSIANKIGRCYEVIIKDFNKVKTLIVHPVHLKREKKNE